MFDELVIGSGLSALGVTMGLLDGAAATGRKLRVGVVTGPPGVGQGSDVMHYRGAAATVPCARLAPGGLGSLWHGVVPLAPAETSALQLGHDSLLVLLNAFYPKSTATWPDAAHRVDVDHAHEWLFVPRRPIRPWAHLQRLARCGQITLLRGAAAPLQGLGAPTTDQRVPVKVDRQELRVRRAWLSAGPLQTPGLLAMLAPRALRGSVDDHVFCYLGRFESGDTSMSARRCGGGLLIRATRRDGALYSQRPAVADFARLDASIESRAVFAASQRRVIGSLLRRTSPGLWAEALFNRFGLFASVPMRSGFAQVRVAEAWTWSGDPGEAPLAQETAISKASNAARAAQPFAGLEPSRRPELWLPGIHLHHTLDAATLMRSGIDCEGSPIMVADASALDDIGAAHPSARVMARAHARALAATTGRCT